MGPALTVVIPPHLPQLTLLLHATVSPILSEDFHSLWAEIIMWQNIPLDNSPDEADSDWEILDSHFDIPHTLSSASEDDPPPASYGATGNVSDDEDEEEYQAHTRGELTRRRKPGGYDSRVEQILYESPEVPIMITDAGKSTESGGRYIVYTIRTGVCLGDASTRFLLTRFFRISRSGAATPSLLPCVTP